MANLLYGCSYYDEYIPTDRIQTDMRMMREAGMNVIRIGESTWANVEPSAGVFDFTHIFRAIEAAARENIQVIIGTPTYAIPPWMAAMHPEIIANTGNGREKYGRRQNMDITSPAYRFYAERIIRKLMEACAHAPNVIGVQLDNETKHYQTCGSNVQRLFVRHLRDTFTDTAAMNRAFGLNYWSNAIDAWEHVPDVTGSINASFVAEFDKFRRKLVTEFLLWQSGIVGEYLREDQFVTQNFDFEWRGPVYGHSFGIQPDVNQKQAAMAVTIAGCDIYHPSQAALTGAEIALFGAVTYGLLRRNYIVLETQAQGLISWLPYSGQLRLQAFSHLAAGANGVMYWHWHTTHQSNETFWKGVLSHDLLPNATYQEASIIGNEIARIGSRLYGAQKKNKVGILVSNESLSGLKRFPFVDDTFDYNNVLRWLYDALYEMNVEADILFPEDSEFFAQYDMLLLPALYSAPDALLQALDAYVLGGGYLISTFKSGFADEYLAVRHQKLPLPHCFGMTYDQFTLPEHVSLTGDLLPEAEADRRVSVWMELLRPETAQVLAVYDHPEWRKYAAVTKQKTGKGTAAYLGCYMEKPALKALLAHFLRDAGLWTPVQSVQFPIIIRSSVSRDGNALHFYMNYSNAPQQQAYLHADATDLLSSTPYRSGDSLTLPPWGLLILEEKAR